VRQQGRGRGLQLQFPGSNEIMLAGRGPRAGTTLLPLPPLLPLLLLLLLLLRHGALVELLERLPQQFHEDACRAVDRPCAPGDGD
jgi:hypothetical protein